MFPKTTRGIDGEEAKSIEAQAMGRSQLVLEGLRDVLRPGLRVKGRAQSLNNSGSMASANPRITSSEFTLKGEVPGGGKEYLVVLFILGVAGLVMWLDKEAAPPFLWQWSVILHDLAMVALTGMTMVHVVLEAIHPGTEASILARLTGWLPEEYVVSHQAKWYEQIRRRLSE